MFLKSNPSAAELLEAWDNYENVPSLEMGGISPGYEQCIQITMFEVLRWMLTSKPVTPPRSETIKGIFETLDYLGLSGAQAGAAINLAWHIYRSGIEKVRSEAGAHRQILVSRGFPSAKDERSGDEKEWVKLRQRLADSERAALAYLGLCDRAQEFCQKNKVGRPGSIVFDTVFGLAEAGLNKSSDNHDLS